MKHLLAPTLLAVALGATAADAPRAPAAASPAASAAGAVEWTAVGGNDSITFYADMASLAAEGDIATMWTLVDSKVERSQGDVRFSSVTTRFAFDCAGQRIRSLETRFHAAGMAAGAVVGRYTEEGAWEPVPEGTVKEGLAQIACQK